LTAVELRSAPETALVEEENPRTKFGETPKSKSGKIPVIANVAVLCGTALCKLNAINDFILQVRLSGKAL
jgi:hypothetical protein